MQNIILNLLDKTRKIADNGSSKPTKGCLSIPDKTNKNRLIDRDGHDATGAVDDEWWQTCIRVWEVKANGGEAFLRL